MTSKLREHFPMIRDREELEEIIRENVHLKNIFCSWEEERQKEFLDFCTGARGIKVLYDSFFKEALNPEYNPERLENLLGVLLNRKVKIKHILPNDSTRIADESALLVTDIIVELEDGSVANVEIQKIGYHFPGQRSACYSADMLLRQYKRIRSQQKENFSYHQIKNVFLIVLYETSPKEFKEFPQKYIHRSKQTFDSGLKIELLQEYVMISLDIFHKSMQYKTIETLEEAWLMFLSSDKPERIIELITRYPEFKPLYETLYQMCRNVEGTMGFFSEELRIMDRNLVKYMVEEQKKEIEANQKVIEESRKIIEKDKKVMEDQKKEIEDQQKEIKDQQKEIEDQQKEIEDQQKVIETTNALLEEKDEKIKMLMKQIQELNQ